MLSEVVEVESRAGLCLGDVSVEDSVQCSGDLEVGAPVQVRSSGLVDGNMLFREGAEGVWRYDFFLFPLLSLISSLWSLLFLIAIRRALG